VIGPERARTQMTELLQSASKSIQIIDHKLDDASVKSILKAKKDAGVEVRVLGEGQVSGLLSHGKLLIVDGRVAVFGALALSTLSLDFRREVSVMVDDPACLRKLREFYKSASAAD
jgi:phosphatidylserine/phosphatidylglycerophosphate/cardiolipin synthase-like enzyme